MHLCAPRLNYGFENPNNFYSHGVQIANELTHIHTQLYYGELAEERRYQSER